MGKRKITCNNNSCKHHTNGGCDTCITLDGSGKCKSFEKGFAYYFHIVWDALDNKNFIDMVEIRMNPDLKTGLFYVMECYDLGFSEMEWGTCRMVMLKDGKEGKPLKYEEIIEREMEKLGYTNNYAVLDAREFGLPQARERVFTISVLNGEKFEFDDLIRTPMRNLQEFLEDDVPDIYDVTQPSVLACIGEKGIRRATVIKDCAYTITTRQDRTPAQVIDRGDGRYRYLTERECWRLMGYSDEDFDRAKAVQERNGKYYKALYDQAGNSIAVPIFESIFRKIILQEVA